MSKPLATKVSRLLSENVSKCNFILNKTLRLTTCLRFFSVGVSSSTISSIPASLRNTSLRSSSKFGVWGLREPKETQNKTFFKCMVSKLEYQTWGQASVRSVWDLILFKYDNNKENPHQGPQSAVFRHGVFERSGGPGSRIQVRFVVWCDKPKGGHIKSLTVTSELKLCEWSSLWRLRRTESSPSVWAGFCPGAGGSWRWPSGCKRESTSGKDTPGPACLAWSTY